MGTRPLCKHINPQGQAHHEHSNDGRMTVAIVCPNARSEQSSGVTVETPATARSGTKVSNEYLYKKEYGNLYFRAGGYNMEPQSTHTKKYVI